MTYAPDSALKEEHLFFSKQPIFTKNPRVWGYELSYRDNPFASVAPDAGRNGALRNLAANAYALKLRGDVGAQKLVLNFSERSVKAKAPNALPASNTVIEMDETVVLDDELLAALDALRAEDYLVAINDFQGRPEAAALLERADILKINIRGKRPQHILDLMNRVPAGKAMLVAAGVGSPELLKLAKALGFKLFQGAFFRKPEFKQERQLTSGEASRLKLFEVISGAPDFNKLSQAIAMDASISYRLLMFLNSAAFSFPVEITSIQHAVVLLGWEQIKNWLRVAVLTDITPPSKTLELVRLAAQRAKFFELTALRNGLPGETMDQLFLLGLFSLLEPMLDMPMEKMLKNLPIDDTVKQALAGKKTPLAGWLALAQAIEDADWETVDTLVNGLGLERALVTGSYYDSHVLTNSFFELSN